MGERRRLGVQDALWLEMDRPTNLMVVDSLVWTAAPIDWERFSRGGSGAAVGSLPGVPQRRRARRRRRLVLGGATRRRTSMPTSSTSCCPSRATTPRCSQWIGSQRTVPLDRGQPLWRMFCVDGFQGRQRHRVPQPPRHRRWHPHGAAGDEPSSTPRPRAGRSSPPPMHQHAARPQAPGQADAPAAPGRRRVGGQGARRAHERGGRPSRRSRHQSGRRDDRAARHASAGRSAAPPRSAAGASVELARTAITNPVGAAHSAGHDVGHRRGVDGGVAALGDATCGSPAAARSSTSSRRCPAMPTSPASSCSARGTTRPAGPAPWAPARRSPGRARCRSPT